MAQISPELDQLSCELIGEAIARLEAGDALPVLLATDAEAEMLAFEDDSPDGCYRAACQQVVDLGASCNRYAIAFDGTIQEAEDEPALPAIIIEFAERGMEQAWSGYLLYRTAEDGGIEVTDPLPAGIEEPLFS